MEFTGFITKIKGVREGSTEKGEWANAEFEVTESNPQNEKYPQIGLFDYFKNGDKVKFAKDFAKMYKVGDEVNVQFSLGKTVYKKKDGSGEGEFYKTSAWMVKKVDDSGDSNSQDVSISDEEGDDLPF
jgi:hypothetical protein